MRPSDPLLLLIAGALTVGPLLAWCAYTFESPVLFIVALIVYALGGSAMLEVRIRLAPLRRR